MPNKEVILLAAILCSVTTILHSKNTERCDICECKMVNSELLLNCSDVTSRSSDNSIRLPYPQSYSSYPFDTIQAEFNRNKIKILPRFHIEDLRKLSLEQNEISDIEPGTFMRLKYLKYLSLKHNFMKTLREKSFQGLLKLETLDLSHNDIMAFNPDTFKELTQLKSLYMSHNKLITLTGKCFSNSIQTLDLSFNNISMIDNEVFDCTIKLAVINLSYNNLSAISTFAFISMRSLASLDLSYNNIYKIEPNSFANLNSLVKLSFSHNTLENLEEKTEFPMGIKIFDASNNFFTEISERVLAINSLQELYMQHNNLKSVGIRDGTKLKILNVSHNQIESFTAPSCQKLEVLDLSVNQLSSVPTQIQGKAMPALRWISLDSNPMRQVRFPANENEEDFSTGFVNLTWVSVSELPNLEELEEGAFSGLSSTCGGCGSSYSNTTSMTVGELENLEQECIRKISIRVAHNPRLTKVQEGAFKDVGLCNLDLSYNSLSGIDQKVLDWEALQEVNLQGNPWFCACSLQWMVDKILPKLYDRYPELLYELRCESPVEIRQRRLVHFYKWPKPALCSTMEKMRMEPTEGENMEISMGFSGPMLAVVVSLAVLAAILVGVAVFWQRRYKRRHRIRNRRF